MRPINRLSLTALALLSSAPTQAANIPAFPGAEGFGGYANGGRGGDVYHVTNLNNSGAGSFADAIATVPTAGRTIVFDISGHIHVNKTRLTKSKVTIAGQTAPGDGIGFKDGTFIISGDDVVIRHARFRYGKQTAGGDCIDLDSGCTNSILDQISIQYSTDENISSFNSPPENLTMQWALNGWGLESHSCGGLWDQNHASCHHTLWAHNHTRNPKARPNGLLQWVNNVTFDWDIGFIMGDSETPASWKANVIGNYFLCPPGNLRSKALEKANLDRNGVPNFSLFLENCLHDNDGDGQLNGTDKGYGIASGNYTKLTAAAAATGAAPITVDPPLTAFKKVVSKAGALRLNLAYPGNIRDEVDAKMVGNVLSQTRQHITNNTALGLTNNGYGTLNSTPAPTDTDRDGMPDYYETALAWNPAVQDHNTALASSGGLVTGTTFFPANTPAGYTRLEEYLHYKAIPHGAVAKNTAGAPTSVSVDLRRYTAGFVKSPAFTVSNAVNGAAVLSGTGNSTLTFTPTQNFVGRARVDFTVTDTDGSTWTQTLALVVTASGLPRDLIWKGDGATNTWNIANSNWQRNGTSTTFGTGDTATFDATGSTTPAIAVGETVSPGNVTVDTPANLSWTGAGAITSTGTLTKSGAGTLTINNSGSNAFTSVTLNEGNIVLGNAAANSSGLGNGQLTFNGGSISLYDAGAGGGHTGVLPNALVINGNVALNAGARCGFSGDVTGSGTLTYYTPYVRADVSGNWSAFSGTLNVISDADGGDYRITNQGATWPLARINLGDKVWMYFTSTAPAGVSPAIGELSGSATSSLRGGPTGGRATTYQIGGLNTSSTYPGVIADQAAGATVHLTKVGSGTLTLSGANTYTGTTTVSGGDLAINGSLGSGVVSVSSGLRGSGSIAGAVSMLAGSKLSPGAVSGAIGTLTLGSAGLTLTSATLSCQLSSSPTGANDKVVLSGGTLTLAGANTLSLQFTDGYLGPGAYDLVTGGASTTGSNANLTVTFPTGGRQGYALSTAAGKVTVTVTGNPVSLVWQGATSGVWDLNSAANWLNGAASGTFYNFDAVTFDDTSTATTITPAGTVEPRSTLVSNSAKALNLNAGLGGVGSLTKTGSNLLTLTGANPYTGGTFINGGTVQLANDAANISGLGTGPITFNGGTLKMSDNNNTYNDSVWNLVVPAGQTGTLWQDGRSTISGSLSGAGTFNLRIPYVRNDWFCDCATFAGTFNITTDNDGGDFRFGTSYAWSGLPNASLFLNGPISAYYIGTSNSGAGTFITLGEVTGTANSRLMGGATGGRNFTYTIGGKTLGGAEAVFAGTIAEQNTGTTTSYVKTGAGIWTLSGSGSWNGSTTVEQGTLKITGNITCVGTVSVQPGATLIVNGGSLDTEALDIAEGATLIVNGTITGDVTNAGTIIADLGGALVVSGDIVNTGTLRLRNGTTLSATGAFANTGVLDLLGSPSGLPANLENSGVTVDASALRGVIPQTSGNTLQLRLGGHTGYAYQLQSSATPAGPWASLGSPQNGTTQSDGQPTNLTFTDTTPPTGSTARRFYRVLVTP